MRFRGGNGRLFSCAAVIAGVLALSPEALAKVTRAGAWPEADKKVSLDVSRVPRDEAIRKLAEAAGWSVVVHAPQSDPVDVHVKDQPADKVLDLLLLDADYVATRDGTLVSIQRTAAAAEAPKKDEPKKDEARGDEPKKDEAKAGADDEDFDPSAGIPVPPVSPVPLVPPVAGVPPVPPLPPLPPGVADAPEADDEDEPHGGVRDGEVMGASLKIAKDEVVDDVSVLGGSLDVYGKVRGDIDVAGGAVRIHEGAHVRGDVSAVGGDIRIEDGARVDGEVVVKGGMVRRGDRAIVGGNVRGHSRSDRGHGNKHPHGGDHDDPAVTGEQMVESKAAEVGSAFARMALLFVFGTVLLALAPDRMDNLKAELVARPMRSFAMGVVGLFGVAAAFVLLCVTVVGIPFAVIGALAGALAFAASLCAVLETAGRALVRHKSQNPYVHLAVGCFLFLGLSAIPVLGKIVVISTFLLATGILVTTRLAGLVQKKNGGAAPYRTAPAM